MQDIVPGVQVAIGGDKAVRRRVLKWLHADHQPGALLRHASAVPDSSMLVAAKPVPASYALELPPTGIEDIPVHKRAAKMWKKWKSALVPGKASSKLSRAVLNHHESQQRPSVSDVYAASTRTAAAANNQSPAAAGAGAAAMPVNLAQAYRSSLYDHTPSSSIPAAPRAFVQRSSGSTSSAAPSARPPTSSAAAPLLLQQPLQQTIGAAHPQQLRSSPTYPQPRPQQQQQQMQWPVTCMAGAGCHRSSSNEEMCWASCRGSQELQSLWSAAAAGGVSSCKVAAPGGLAQLDGATSSGSMPLGPNTPAAAAAAAAAAAGHTQTLQLQRSLSKGSSSPASACAIRASQSLPAAPWRQQHHQTTTSATHPSPVDAAVAVRASSPSPLLCPAQPPACSSLYQGSKAATGVGSSPGAAACLAGTAMTAYPALVAAAVSGPAAGNAARHSTTTTRTCAACDQGNGSSSIDSSAVFSSWLLRAALFEDELQGRALEVHDGLQQAAERREQLEALLLGMSGCKGAGAAVTTGHLDAAWQQLSQEHEAIAASAARLSRRAAALGSGLAALQGCMTVMQGSRGSRLTPASKLGVLQLVLGDVVACLPGEKLAELELCQGLPAISTAGQQLCSLAGADGAAAEPASSCAGAVRHDKLSHQQQNGWAGDDDDVGVSEFGDGDENGDDDDDDDDDVIATLSTALSRKFYTPRHSLAYESRRSSMAAEHAAEVQHCGYFDRRPDNSVDSSSQPLQQQQDQLCFATLSAAAEAAEALLAAVPRSMGKVAPAAADMNVGTAAPPAAAGFKKSNSRQSLRPLLESEPLDCWDEDSACFQSADSSSCCNSSEAYTAASQRADVEHVLAHRSATTEHSSHSSLATAVCAGARAGQFSSAHAPAPQAGHAPASVGDLGGLPVQDLLSAVGAPDLSSLTVGEMLQLLTKAVVQQQQLSAPAF